MADDVASLVNSVSVAQARIKQLESQIEAEKGKALAAVRAGQAATREADIAKKEAQAYREETDASIANAADQLRQAMALSIGIWSLGRLGSDVLKNRTIAARMLHREDGLIKVLSDFADAHKKGDPGVVARIATEAGRAVAIYRQNTEQLKFSMIEDLVWASIAHGKKKATELVNAMLVENAEHYKAVP